MQRAPFRTLIGESFAPKSASKGDPAASPHIRLTLRRPLSLTIWDSNSYPQTYPQMRGRILVGLNRRVKRAAFIDVSERCPKPHPSRLRSLDYAGLPWRRLVSSSSPSATSRRERLLVAILPRENARNLQHPETDLCTLERGELPKPFSRGPLSLELCTFA